MRLEIAAALKRRIPVSPVLVDGASMPQAGNLPDDLKPLVRRQALRVSYERFHADAQPLIGVVEQVMGQQRAIAGKRVEEGVAKFERAYWTVLYWFTVASSFVSGL